MKRQYTRNYQMLTRVADFGSKNVSLFPKTSVAAETIGALNSAVSKLSEQSIAEVTSEAEMQTSQNKRKAARVQARKLVDACLQTARVVDAGGFKPPVNHGEPALVATGKAFALAAAPLSKEFARHGLPKISEDLTAAVEELELAILDYTNAKARRASAIREFDQAMTDAIRELERFEVLVANTLGENPTAIASWQVARYVSRTAGRKAAPKPPAPPADPEAGVTKAA